ncbi:hypothetical protein U3A55_13435 [Salarchaeum sp. III]|uniref:hypothetical protein n=1 Tax=Salarchaeum sp. III TaxID=3107927 RepID=UPI002EDA335C
MSAFRVVDGENCDPRTGGAGSVANPSAAAIGPPARREENEGRGPAAGVEPYRSPGVQ